MRKVMIWIAVVVLAGSTATAADTAPAELVKARALYESADYSAALRILNQLNAAGAGPDDVVAIQQYRALCFLALGDAPEAQRAVEVLLHAVPSYRLTGDDVSPRLQAAFTDARRRLLPTLIRQKYATAKAAYDRHDVDLAGASFREVVSLLDDPDVAAAGDASLADLKLVAAAFVELSARTAPAPAAAAPVATAPGATVSRSAANRLEFYSTNDADVTPPAPVAQSLPPYRGSVSTAVKGAIKVTVDQRGNVANVSMLIPTYTPYDAVALAAARKWRYKPATLDGAPVKYVKVVYINIAPAEPAVARSARVQ